MGNVKLLAIFFAPPHVAVCVERTLTVLRQQKKDVNVKLQRALQLWPAMPILRMQSEIRFWLVQSQISFYFRQSQISLRFLQHFTSLWRCKLSQNNDQIYWYKVHFNSPLMLTVCSPKSSRHLMFHKLSMFSDIYFSGLFRFSTISIITSWLLHCFLFQNWLSKPSRLHSLYVTHQRECLLVCRGTM